MMIIDDKSWRVTMLLGYQELIMKVNPLNPEYEIHRIGWWENLQENPIFDGKNHGFL